MMLHKNISVILRLLLATFFFIPVCANSQTKQKKTRILFLLDASSSMTYNWNNAYTRFDVASNILLKIMDSIYSINNEIEFAVRAYGTTYPAQLQNCVDTKLEVPFNLQNTNQIKTRLKNITPIGTSPIAFSLKKASEEELNDAVLYDYSVIFITDGGESCNGDVCGIYQELLQKKISIKPYIIGLDKNETLKSYYSCFGNYIEVSTVNDIEKAIAMIVDANKSIIEKPRQLKLITKLSNTPAIKDSIKPKPVIKDTPVISRPVKDISALRFLAYNKSLHANAIMKAVAIKKMKREKASLQFEWEEPKKSIASLSELIFFNPPVKKSIPVFTAKKISVKKEKASLHFDYEEARKTSPALNVLPLYAGIRIKNASPIIAVKKAAYKFPKNAQIHFEYEEAKKSSPVMMALSPVYIKEKSKIAAAVMIAKRPAYKFPKNVSIHFEYEEPKKMSPIMAMLLPVYAGIHFTRSVPVISVKKTAYRFPKNASIHFEYEEPKKETLAVLNIIKYPRRYSYAYRMPDFKMLDLKNKKAILHFTVEEKKVAKKDTIITSTLPVLPNSSVEFTTQVTADKETLVQVYFKGTNGKTYNNAKPTIEMQDVQSNATVTSFRRDMNGAEPVPQKVLPGKYNLIIKGFDDLYANNIEIKPNTITKVLIKVSDGTLKFTYQGNIKRPVSEYKAIVNRRFAAGATVVQKCSDVLTYEPGTYYVEINTLPVYRASIDLTFDAVYEIQISEPGTLAIMNTLPLGKVQIQSMSGDQYLTFYTMNITGNLNEQRVQLLPFSYKLIYPADPNHPQLGNKELMIKVKSNQQIELELK